MRNLILTAATALTGLAFTACSSEDVIDVNNPQAQAKGEQVITLSVSGTGSGFSTRAGNAPERSLFSAEAAQSINYVKVVVTPVASIPTTDANIVTSYQPKSGTDFVVAAQVLYDDWMTQSKGGADRKLQWKLPKGTLPAGDYLAYAIGVGDQDNYTEARGFLGLADGATIGKDKLPLKIERGRGNATTRQYPFEFFAGMAPFTVDATGNVAATVSLERQISGAIGYFKNIPVKGDAAHANAVGVKLRLVSSAANNGAFCGGFNTGFTTTNNNVAWAVNGYTTLEPGSIALPDEAQFVDGTKAFVVYEDLISNWFSRDVNGDGVYNEDDNAAWTNKYASQGVTVMKNSMLIANFAFPFQATSHNTLQLQMLDAAGDIIRYWDVSLPQNSTANPSANPAKTDQSTQIGQFPYIINYDKSTSKYSFDQTTTAETKDKYSFMRNHIYCIGTRMKNNPGGGDNPDNPQPGTDDPQDLTRQSIQLNVIGGWEEIHDMVLD